MHQQQEQENVYEIQLYSHGHQHFRKGLGKSLGKYTANFSNEETG
jgi:hypothetical protein